ncbi:MAG: hypothetical protein ACYDEX_17505 [Mobilitalea sp.]
MSRSGNNHNNGNGNGNSSLLRHICEFVGETVTIFTTSGGASGCGFTGVILSVNPCFVRLVTEQGLAPSNPLAENICGEFEDGPGRGDRGSGDNGGMNSNGRRHKHIRTVGSVCDIPIDRIVAFCHNAV